MKNRRITTQIGSLPYEDPSEAVEYSLRHDIPFLPELPKLGDAMLDYIKNPGTLSCLDEFKNQVLKQKRQTVKVQCVGPSTLIQSGYDADEAIQRIYEHIAAVLDGIKSEEIILFLDEPALGYGGFDYKKLWTPLFGSFNVVPGVHTCGNLDWDGLFDSDISIISFDASKFDITRYPKYRGSKRIAWGIGKAGDARDFREGDLLTLPCGMHPRLYTPDDCEEMFKMLESAAKEVSKHKDA